jgi:hypothetical protein
MVGMVGARLDHVKVGAGDTAAQRRQVAQRLAQALQARAVELVAQPAQQQAVADHQGAAVKHVEEAPPAGGIDRAARFQRQRDVGAVVGSEVQPEQRPARVQARRHRRASRRPPAAAHRPVAVRQRAQRPAADRGPVRGASPGSCRPARCPPGRPDRRRRTARRHRGQGRVPRPQRRSAAPWRCLPGCSADRAARATSGRPGGTGCSRCRPGNRGVGGRIHQKITSRLRIMAGSASRFIARCRSTSASPKTRRM